MPTTSTSAAALLPRPLPLWALITILTVIVLLIIIGCAAWYKVRKMKNSRTHADKRQEEAAMRGATVPRMERAAPALTGVGEARELQEARMQQKEEDQRRASVRPLPWVAN